ncbi:MAG: hypothetical protein ACLRMZ_10245 [Blautia marasmi]
MTVSDYKMTPLVMHYDSEKKNCAVYKVSDYTEELAKEHGIHQQTEETFTLDSIKELAAKYESPQAFPASGQSSSDAPETEVKGKGVSDGASDDPEDSGSDTNKENTDKKKALQAVKTSLNLGRRCVRTQLRPLFGRSFNLRHIVPERMDRPLCKSPVQPDWWAVYT